jgi:hypothetical protein
MLCLPETDTFFDDYFNTNPNCVVLGQFG